jgi:hypothetical protein
METQRSRQAGAVVERQSAATFTKWLVGDGPEMAGIVGGLVGDGTYSGTVLALVPGEPTTVEAQYRFSGSERSFTALVHVEQAGLEAAVVGVVTDGWAKGSKVEGEYDEIRCEHDGVTTACWRGSLRIVAD